MLNLFGVSGRVPPLNKNQTGRQLCRRVEEFQLHQGGTSLPPLPGPAAEHDLPVTWAKLNAALFIATFDQHHKLFLDRYFLFSLCFAGFVCVFVCFQVLLPSAFLMRSELSQPEG